MGYKVKRGSTPTYHAISFVKRLFVTIAICIILAVIFGAIYKFNQPFHDLIQSYLYVKVEHLWKGALGGIVALAVIWAIAMEGSKKEKQ